MKNGISRHITKKNKKEKFVSLCLVMFTYVVHCSLRTCMMVEYGLDTSCTNSKMDVYSRTRMINAAAEGKKRCCTLSRWSVEKLREHPNRHKNHHTNIFPDIIKVFIALQKLFPSSASCCFYE